jgi:NitT/TauT family transport system substrate-binding protein
MERFRNLPSGFLCVAAILLAGLFAPARAADEAHTLTLRLEWLPVGYHSPFWIAVEKGWFKDAGLDVTISDGTGSVTTVQLVGQGQYDLGHAGLANMAIGRNKGVPVIAIAGFFREGDTSLIVPNDSPINGPKDLKGKKAIYTANSLEAPFIDPFLAAGGLTRDDVELINVDPNTRNSQYLAGAVDANIGPAPSVVLAEKLRPSRLIPFADFGLNLPSFGLFANKDALAKKGPAIRQFASIVAGAWTYILKGHEDEGIAALVKEHEAARLDPAVAKANLEVGMKFLYSPATKNMPIGFQTESDWATAIAVMEKAKVIEPGSKPADYFTNDYLDAKTIATIGGE